MKTSQMIKSVPGKKGYFTCEYVPGPVYVHPAVWDKLVEAAGKHIEWVDKNGPSDTCKCPYCNEKRREEFEELYGGEE